MSSTNLKRSLATERGVSRSPDEWYLIGNTALRNQQVPEAEEAFRNALLVDSNHGNENFRPGEEAENGDERDIRSRLSSPCSPKDNDAGGLTGKSVGA
jgi:hypothetical protein